MSARLSRKPIVTTESLAKWVTKIEGSGVDAKYNSINHHWGFKWFESRFQCLSTHFMQSLAHRFKFGPAIGEVVEFEVPVYGKYFGYLTQKAIPLKMLYKQWGVNHYPGGNTYNDGEKYRCQNYKDMGFPDLWKKSQKLGIILDDLHYANVGYLTTNGKGVMIDFGHCSYRGAVNTDTDILNVGILDTKGWYE